MGSQRLAHDWATNFNLTWEEPVLALIRSLSHGIVRLRNQRSPDHALIWLSEEFEAVHVRVLSPLGGFFTGIMLFSSWFHVTLVFLFFVCFTCLFFICWLYLFLIILLGGVLTSAAHTLKNYFAQRNDQTGFSSTSWYLVFEALVMMVLNIISC